MLLAEFCSQNQNCERCTQRESCVVQQLLYAKYDITLEFVTSGESNGYIWVCNCFKENLSEQEKLRVSLTLFGVLLYTRSMKQEAHWF